jgi:hypothetical protein
VPTWRRAGSREPVPCRQRQHEHGHTAPARAFIVSLAQQACRCTCACELSNSSVRDLLVDLARRPTHARELWGLRTDPTWLDHLTRDRYLSRAAFERRYARAFPGAHFWPVGGVHAMLWRAPNPDDRPRSGSQVSSAEDLNSYGMRSSERQRRSPDE